MDIRGPGKGIVSPKVQSRFTRGGGAPRKKGGVLAREKKKEQKQKEIGNTSKAGEKTVSAPLPFPAYTWIPILTPEETRGEGKGRQAPMTTTV